MIAVGIRVGNTALQRGSAGVEVLTRDRQVQVIKVAKRRQIGCAEGSV